jgi:hypothetical protein
MSTYAVKIGDDDHGPFAEEEVAPELERYRAEHPEDPEFAKVVIWEMPEHGTVGHPRSVWDFVDEDGKSDA